MERCTILLVLFATSEAVLVNDDYFYASCVTSDSYRVFDKHASHQDDLQRFTSPQNSDKRKEQRDGREIDVKCISSYRERHHDWLCDG